MEEITVSIIILTYQHRKYIKKALDSVLAQKLECPYEILIGDDCSTDGTREILLEYKYRFGKRIKLFLHKRNNGATRNAYILLKYAKGKYISYLEGDDYWIDDNKLQKQIDYLEAHDDYSGVFHKCMLVDENDKRIHMNYKNLFYSRDGFSIKDYERGCLPGQPGTLLCRNIFKESKGRYNFLYKIHNLVGDQTMYCLLLSQGDLGYINQEMGAYRFVQKADGPNAISRHLKKNFCFVEWRYHCQLEICLQKRAGVQIDLSAYRQQDVREAKYKFMSSRNFENLRIFLQVWFFNIMWNNVLRYCFGGNGSFEGKVTSDNG